MGEFLNVFVCFSGHHGVTLGEGRLHLGRGAVGEGSARSPHLRVPHRPPTGVVGTGLPAAPIGHQLLDVPHLRQHLATRGGAGALSDRKGDSGRTGTAATGVNRGQDLRNSGVVGQSSVQCGIRLGKVGVIGRNSENIIGGE